MKKNLLKSLPNVAVQAGIALFFTSLILMLHESGFGQAYVTYTTSGIFTAPAGVTNVQVECWGGGGAGGGRTGSVGCGGGGGGGTYTLATGVPVVSGTFYTITVGLGAIGTNTSGSGGGASSAFLGSTVTANGGGGGSNGGTAGLGGIGGTYNGGDGAPGHSEDHGGGGGGSAGTASNGNPGIEAIGATAVPGGGPGGNGITGGYGNGFSPASGPGGGGGGCRYGNADVIGGSGANGQVIIRWACNLDVTNFNTTASSPVYTGGISTVIVNSSTLVSGTYTVYYNLSGANTATAQSASMIFSSGSGTFPTITMANSGSTTITITSVGCANPATGNISIVTVYATNIWLGTTDSDWNTASNWSGGVPTSSSNVVVHSGLERYPVIGETNGICRSIALMEYGSSISGTGQLTIDNDAGIVDVTGTATISCPIDMPASPNVIVSGTLTISGVISNITNNWVKDGPGTLILSALNDFSGQTVLFGGTVIINTLYDYDNNSSLGRPSILENGTIDIAGNAILRYIGTGHTSNRVIEVYGNIGGSIDVSGSGTLTLTGQVIKFGINPSLVLTGTGIGVIEGVIDNGIGSITKTGSGTWTLSDANTFTGDLNMQAGTLNLGSNALNIDDLTITGGSLTSSSNTLSLTGNFSNSGTFNHNSGNVKFNGNSAQTIGGSASTTFNNLEIANTNGGVSLTKNETVSGTLTLTSGILTTDITNLLSVTSTATTAISAGSASKFINGPLEWSLALGTYNFPIGKNAGNYLPFTLAVSAASSPVVTIEAFATEAAASATFDEPLSSISHTEFWKAALNSGTFTGKVSLTRTNPLTTEDVIGKSPAQGGIYTSIGGTPISQSIINSDNISNLSYFVMATTGFTVSGSIRYHNAYNTPMSNVSIELWQPGGGKVYPVTGDVKTNSSGQYTFGGVGSGIYEIRLSATKDIGGINSTDAAQANNWFAHQTSIEMTRFLAGDVDENYFVGPTDAQRIQGYFVNAVAFDRDLWSFWMAGQTISGNPGTIGYPTVTVANADLSPINFYGLCTGDFSRSFVPGAKDGSANLQLAMLDTRKVTSNSAFELPVVTTSAVIISAVSMILNFPSDLVQVTGVSIADNAGMLDWAVSGDELRIGWNSSVPISLSTGSELLMLKLKTTEAFTTGNSIRISLAANPLNELADGMFDVIGNAVLGIDVIEASTLGVPETPPTPYALCFSAYPNPFKNFTTITYTLPFDGQVTLEVYNFLGMKVEKLVSEEQTAGNHVVKFNTAGMESGVFTATLVLKSNEDQLFRTIKLVYNK